MIEPSSHAGFIIAAYGIATVVIGSMVVVILSDYRVLKQQLKRFGDRGLDRQ